MIFLTNRQIYCLSWLSALFLFFFGEFLVSFGFARLLYMKEILLGVISFIFGVGIVIVSCTAVEKLLKKQKKNT